MQEAQEPGDEGQVARLRQADVRGVELLEARLVQHALEAPEVEVLGIQTRYRLQNRVGNFS